MWYLAVVWVLGNYLIFACRPWRLPKQPWRSPQAGHKMEGTVWLLLGWGWVSCLVTFLTKISELDCWCGSWGTDLFVLRRLFYLFKSKMFDPKQFLSRVWVLLGWWVLIQCNPPLRRLPCSAQILPSFFICPGLSFLQLETEHQRPFERIMYVCGVPLSVAEAWGLIWKLWIFIPKCRWD